MEGTAYSPSNRSDWKQLYMAALFEDDTAMIPQRIAEAEMALAARADELGEDRNQVREQQAIENATYFLRLLRKIGSKANTLYESPHPSARPHSHQEEWA